MAYCLIADQIIQVADDRLCRLLLDFTVDPTQVDVSNPVCTVHLASDFALHGVRSLRYAHPVDHVLLLDRDPSGIILADDGFENVTVFSRFDPRYTEVMLAGIYSRLAYFRTVFVHGALVNIPHWGGLMFVGDSGVGKTTQATLWEKYRNAEIINGDKVFLGLRDHSPGRVMAYGSPWPGSSPYCVNKCVPLRAIVVLKRGEQAYLRCLSDVETLSAYVPHVFMPNWDPRLTEKVMDTLDAMLPSVPVYEMCCTPDLSAVTMVEEIVLGQQN